MNVDRTQEQLFDVRLRERHLKKNLFDEKTLKKWIKELPDAKDNAASVSAADIFGEIGGSRRSENQGQ